MNRAINSAKNYFHKWKIKINDTKTDAVILPYNKAPKRNPINTLSIGNDILSIQRVMKY